MRFKSLYGVLQQVCNDLRDKVFIGIEYQVIGYDRGVEYNRDVGVLMACQLYHAVDETFEVEQGRFGSGDACEFTVGLYESEQALARGTDGLQPVTYLFF